MKLALYIMIIFLLTGCWHQIEKSAIASCKFEYSFDNHYVAMCISGAKIAREYSEEYLSFKSNENDILKVTRYAEKECFNHQDPNPCVFGISLFREHATK